MPTNVGRANIGTKIFQGRVETRYGEGLKKSVVNEACRLQRSRKINPSPP
jgi:hypothetical protein